MHQVYGDTLFDYCKKVKSASANKQRDRNIVSTLDDIAVFCKESSRKSGLDREYDFSGESDGLSMHQWVFRS